MLNVKWIFEWTRRVPTPATASSPRCTSFSLLAAFLAFPLVWSATAVYASTVIVNELEDSFRFPEANSGLSAPRAVGDINGDGNLDFAFAASSADPEAGDDAGIVYLLFGPIAGQGADVAVAEVADATISGIDPGGALGRGKGIGGGGDLNGDGIDDLVLAAPLASGNQGAVYVLFGRTSGWAEASLAQADAILTASATSNLGEGGVVLPGDLDGDGLDDLVIAAHTASSSGLAGIGCGLVYVFYGTGDWADRTLDSADAILKGDSRTDGLGSALISVDDINGDQLPDLVMSAAGRDVVGTDAGTLYVVPGGARLSGLLGIASVALAQIQGDAAEDSLGSYIAGGDANGDGLSDLLISAHLNDQNGDNTGQVYLIYGRQGDWPAPSTRVGTLAQISFVGVAAQDRLGSGVGPIIDLNQDGVGDFVMGVPDSDLGGSDAGEVAVFLGPISRWSLQTSVTEADLGIAGEAISDAMAEVSSDCVGYAAAEGRPFLALASPYNDEVAQDSGKVYLVPVQSWLDQDQDNFTPQEGDCNDIDATVYPSAPELCDGLDNNCDGVIDEGFDGTPFYYDGDQDGFGAGQPVDACSAPPGYSPDSGDCDDSSPEVFPGAPELCDGLDNDCDGQPANDEIDADGDGFVACEGLTGQVDCDDGDATSYPGAPELCDGHDNDCDGNLQPEEDDEDQDGYLECNWDCNDQQPDVHFGAEEICDGFDSNCDGTMGPEEEDADGDGVPLCAGDCDEEDPSVYPGALELCDGLDNDCDGALSVEESDPDGDGAIGCSPDGGPVDCDQTDPAVYPGAEEICDGLDSDCDGDIPPEEMDVDQDGYTSCAIAPDPGDCDDGNSTVYPGAPELCDGLDNNCDEEIDNNVEYYVYYEDLDGDGFGNDDSTIEACSFTPGYVTQGGDCDDANPDVNPAISSDEEDGIDNDCDGEVDEDALTGDDDTASGDDDVSPGDDDVSPGDDDVSPGDDDATDSAAREDDSTGCSCSHTQDTHPLPSVLLFACVPLVVLLRRKRV